MFHRARASVSGLQQTCNAAFTRPTFALPVDGFRILVGLLSLLYLIDLIRQVPDFSSPDGLIDHALLQNALWFTRLSLFQPGMAVWHFYVVFTIGLFAAGLVTAGWHPKFAAAYLYLVFVSTYRWNFLVIYLDDCLMHLALAWLLLLPIGRTLTVQAWLRDGRRAWMRWQLQTVPGPAVYCFLGNLAMIYLVAGLWKWTSPMWLDGSALYAGLKMPISLAPDFWQPVHLPVLRAINYVVLLIEPALCLLVVLPKHHPAKWLLVAGALCLHGGTILTLHIPYANAVCLFGLVLVLREELMDFLRSPVASPERRLPALEIDLPGRLALTLVTLLALTMIGDTLPWWIEPGNLSRQPGPAGMTIAPGQVQDTWRQQHGSNTLWNKWAPEGNPFYIPLWLAGIAQKYRLFDWIDDVNYTAHYEIRETGQVPITGPAAAARLFPPGTRGATLQAAVTDVRWTIVPAQWSNVVKRSVLKRVARRYCQNYTPRHVVAMFVTVERITLDNPELNQGQSERLMAFTCRAGEPRMAPGPGP